MLDTFKALLDNQYAAALCTLNSCIDGCPDDAWEGLVVEHSYCETVFHTLFFCDVYLGKDEDAFRREPFHAENTEFFRDYEELQDRKPELLYDKPGVRRYMSYVRERASAVIAAETAESLNGPSGFDRRDFTRAELHLMNIRHVQHHAAALGLKLRLERAHGIPWCASGWRDAARSA